MKSIIGSVATTFVGNYYGTDGTIVTKYYGVYPAASGAGSQRVATLAPGASAGVSVGGTVYYLLSDQLGSTTATTDAAGTKVSELRYDAWGGLRYTSGTTPTAYTYTGQYSNVDDFGLMYYNARWPQGPYHRALCLGRHDRAARSARVRPLRLRIEQSVKIYGPHRPLGT